MDLYWTVTAGVEPLDYLGRYDQSRWPLFHVKDRNAAGEFADLGEGNIDFARIFRELQNKHYHHYIVERDTQVNPARTAAVGYEYLRDLRGRRQRRPYTTTEAGTARPPRERGGRRHDPTPSIAWRPSRSSPPWRCHRAQRPVPGPVAVPEGHAQRPSRRADEPCGAAGRARAARRAHGRDPPARPADRHEQHRHGHEGGPAGALPARRGGRPGHRDRPGVRGEPVGLRLLLAEAEHAEGRGRHGHQRGRRAGEPHDADDRARLALFNGYTLLSRFKCEQQPARLRDRAGDPPRHDVARHLLPRRRPDRLRRRGQPVPVDGR